MRLFCFVEFASLIVNETISRIWQIIAMVFTDLWLSLEVMVMTRWWAGRKNG